MPRFKRVKDSQVEKGRVRVHDPFELIRWLALSQPDSRKALAELVQNSLDASARRVRITRVREKGHACLKISDDGEGVIPEMNRPDALRFIATHVGHSRKRSLSPEQRLQLMTQGQYGIGLLGFWSLGQMLEIRSAVPYQKPYRLILHRDRPEYEIEPLRGKLSFEELWTEVVVVGLHRPAMTALSARRAADYLASELRGQLLAREVELTIEDRISRGRAAKSIVVRPPRFLGEKLEGLEHLEVPGQPPARLEIYLAGDDETAEPHGVALYAAGTLVAEGFEELAPLGLDHPPWTDTRLTGLVDFPGARVAPGSRRGVIPDAAAYAFAAALAKVEPLLSSLLESRERERAEQLDRNLIRDLQRAFRDFYRQRPRYTMLPTRAPSESVSGEAGSNGDGGAAVEEVMPGAGSHEAADLFPPGPLESVRIVPARVVVECGTTREVRAVATDAGGRALDATVSYEWSLSPPVGTITQSEVPDRARLTAADRPADGTLGVVARSQGREASAQAAVEVVLEILGSRGDEGIPEPELVDQPGASWRSRLLEGQWQVNSGHPDYKAIAARAALKLRYLALLFSKEVVLQSTQDPRLEDPLEQVVEVAAYADRRLTDRPARRQKERPREN